MLLGSTAALAQSPAALPPTREEVTRPENEALKNRAPQLEVEGGLERAPCALDSPQFANVRFTGRGAAFAGLEGRSPDDLASSYLDLIGTEQPISVVCEIRDRAAAILRDAGYIAAIEVPEQRIADGIIRYRVLMAHLGQVRVRGNATGAERIIAAYLTQLTKQPVFNRFDAERYLLLASDLPGYTVRLTLRPGGGTPGEVLGDVTVQRTPVYADASVQNGGSREVGRWGAFARAQIFGLTGLADRTTLAAFTTADLKEQQTVQLGHDFRVGSQGLGLGGMLTYAWADPTIRPAGNDVRARSLLGTIQADYPFVRSVPRSLRGSLGLDVINQDVDFNGQPLSRDRLRVGFARVAFDALNSDFTNGRSLAEPLWHVGADLELRKGLAILGASEGCVAANGCTAIPISREGASPTAAVVRALLYGEYRPDPKVTFALAARAQYAWRPLLSFEQFAAGNYTVGRGYDPGSLLGDRGWGTQAEIRVGSRIPQSAGKAALQGYAFWDHARAIDLNPTAGASRGSHLDSVGAGARVNFSRFAVDASLAVPMTTLPLLGRKPGPRILVSLISRLWPWTYK
jgi:hemolysin activation/secretion protein